MDREIAELWLPYRNKVFDLYRNEVEAELTEPSDEVAAELDDRASRLTEALLRALEPEEPEDADELETAVLTTAALDVAVASELILTLQREEEGQVELPDEVLEMAPAREELESIGELLWRANSAFGEGMAVRSGAAPDFSAAGARAQGAIEQILDGVIPPANAFTRGLVLAEIDTLRAGLNLFPGLAEVSIGHRRFQIAAGLMAKAVEKLFALIKARPVDDLIEHFGLNGLAAALEMRLKKLNKSVVRNVVRAGTAELSVEMRLRDKELDESRTVALDASLSLLCLRFETNMRSAATIAKWVGWAAPGVVLFGGILPGKVAVGAVNGAGLAYCLFSCADRLDTVPGWVAGVPKLVERA